MLVQLRCDVRLWLGLLFSHQALTLYAFVHMGYSKQVPHLQEECFVCVEHIHYELSSSCIGNDEHTNLIKT